MQLSASAITESILALERCVGLDDAAWTEQDVHWWPLYRTEIYRVLFIGSAGASVSAPAAAKLGSALRLCTSEDGPKASDPVWLVSDGLSFAAVNFKREVERFCGPLWHQCVAAHVPAVIVDRASPAPRSMLEPSRWWAPWTQRAKIMGAMGALLAPHARHARLVAMVQAAARSLGLAPLNLSAGRTQAMADATLRLATVIEPRLRAERVRAVFIVSYYDVAGYAYTLAAARAGIVSVDVQHGVTGRFNMAYSRWPVTQSPWRLLPSRFWTWTESDAALIKAWAPPGMHQAVCGGNPFLDAWRDGTLQLEPAMSQKLAALRERTDARTPVLVSLQPRLVHEQALAPLLGAMALSKKAFWWLRLHPMGLHDKPALEALLALKGLTAFDIDAATALPLPVVLSHARMHATHSSSAFIEAAALGIPSIVWSAYGAELAEADITDGSTRSALDGLRLAAMVDSTAESALAPASGSLKGPDALQTLLGSGPP